MTLEQNKAIVRGYLIDIVNKGDVAALDRYFSADVVFNGAKGLEQQLARIRAIRSAFPDHHLTIEDQIAERDRVVTRVIFEGTHQGEFIGAAPPGSR